MSALGYLLRGAWALRIRLPIGPRQPVVILYHGVPRSHSASIAGAEFEKHVSFLTKHCECIHPRDLERRRSPGGRVRVLLTFDDGFRNNAEVAAPILRQHRMPAVFFVSSRHATPGRYLWFSYLWALESEFPGSTLTFRGERFDMSRARRPGSVARLKEALLGLTPHPAAMYRAIDEELPPLEDFVNESVLADRYAGMSAAQAGELAADPLFAVGVHTVDHPFLTRCEPAEARRQIQQNRQWLEAACGVRCDTIAYPSGNYDDSVLALCRSVGLKRGYAVAARRGEQSELALSRLGIYSPSTDVLGFKLAWGGVVRRTGLPIG